MTDPGVGLLRAVRAAVLGCTVLALAVLAHATAGGALPGLHVLAVLAGALGVAGWAAAGRRWHPVAILAVLAGGQAALHGALSVLGETTAPPPGHRHGVVHDAGARLPETGDLLTQAGAVSGHPDHASSSAMLVAHVVATVATGVVLAHGEQLVWWLWRLAGPCRLPEPVPLRWSFRAPLGHSGRTATTPSIRGRWPALRAPPQVGRASSAS